MEDYLKENNIDHIAWGPYNPKHQGVVEVFNKTIQDFLYQLRIVKEKYCLVDSINDFLIYYNDKMHSNSNGTI